MDGPLTTNRQGFGGGNYHGGSYRGGGGGYHRGGRRGRGGRHRGRRTPWRDNRGGRHRRPPQEPKNRTTTSTPNNNTIQNQVRCMITKMTLSSNNLRAEVSQNMNDLSSLLMDQKEMFFNNETHINEYIIDCVVNLPNYQDAYAAFTICLDNHENKEEDAMEEKDDIKMIESCVKNACDRFTNDLLNFKEARSFIRCKLILRYLVYLSHAGVIQSGDGMSLWEFIQFLCDLAIKLRGTSQSILLALLIMETLPYVMITPKVSKEQISSLLSSLEEQVLQNYKSGYKPTNGIYAILLSQEIDEEDDDDEEEEDEDEPCSDTLQDLLRNLKSMLQEDYNDFTPFTSEFLWKDMDIHSNASLMINTSFVTTEMEKMTCYGYKGIIYGRFPIFSAAMEDDDEMNEKENNPYVEQYTTIDKYFLHCIVRDVCISYKPQITPSGSTTGDISDVMEQIQSIKECFTPNKHNGIDYGILECLIGLLVQPTQELNFIYVSRVILQYVKSSPSTIPQIVVSGLSTIFEDLLPSMSPTASLILSTWLGFHLVNTDFQWPDVLWEYWMKTYKDTTTHEIFVRNTIHAMIMFSDIDTVKAHFKIPDDFNVMEEESEVKKELFNKMITLKEDSANIATWLCSLDKHNTNWSTLVLSTILTTSDVQTTLERYIPLITIMMDKDKEESDELSPQLDLLKILFKSSFYKASVTSLLAILQGNKLVTSNGVISFVLDDCVSYWWLIIRDFLQVVSQSDDGDMVDVVDKKKVILESIGDITKGFVQSLKGHNTNDYKLVAKLEGMKFVVRQLQLDVDDQDLLDCVGVESFINGLDGDDVKGLVQCLKDGKSAGFVW